MLQQKIDDAIVKMRILGNSFLKANLDSQRAQHSQLSVSDADTLIQGLRKVFNSSPSDEQTRLLTVAPPDWGRYKIRNFFGCSEHQARTALELRHTAGVLAYPILNRGNELIDHGTIDKVIDYYRRDGISRPSAKRKDVVLISGTPVGKRFMEMTISQAFESFCVQYPSVKISRSKFFELRPKDVKPESPHDVCVCIYHENLTLLLKVSEVTASPTITSDLIYRHGMRNTEVVSRSTI